MARPQVPDSNVFIRLSHDPDSDPKFFRLLGSGRIWLCSVVAAEVYFGTRSQEDREAIGQIARTLKTTNRLLTPTHDEWVIAATLVARYSRTRGEVALPHHLHDALIAVSTARLQGEVVTANTKHFETWAALARDNGLDVIVRPYEPHA